MFKKTTAAIILSAVIMAGSSVSAFAETPVQTVVVEQEYAASAAKIRVGKAALKRVRSTLSRRTSLFPAR